MHKLTKAQIKLAVENSNGTYTSVAKRLKVKSSLTAKKYVEKYPDLLEEFNRIQDMMADEAESVIMDNLKSQNEFIRARTAEFLAKNLPRSRFKDVVGEDIQSQLVKLLGRMMDNTNCDTDPDKIN